LEAAMKTAPLLALGSMALIAFSATSQDLVVDVNLRLLDVFVEDESGLPVLDLKADDFEVLENGQPQEVKHLTLETQPVAVGLVLDRSSSISPVKKEVDEAVMHVLKVLRPDDEVFLITFAGDGRINVGLTTAHRNISEAIGKAKLGYGTRIYDVLVDALEYLSTSSLNRKMLVAFSDGADHYSVHTFQQVLDAAAHYAAPIYTLGYAGDDSRTWSDKGRREIQWQFEQLARVSGGKAYFPGYRTDCSAIARQILQRLRYEYRLGFYSTLALTDLPAVQVRVRGGGGRRVTVRDAGRRRHA
jgi:VWFA-related protein